jgi:hypothetical protein
LRSAGAPCALRGRPALCGGTLRSAGGILTPFADYAISQSDRTNGTIGREVSGSQLSILGATLPGDRGTSLSTRLFPASRHIFEHADLLPSSEVNPRHQRPTPAHVRFMPLCRICCGLLGRDGATRAVRKGAGHDRGPPLPLWREFCPTMMGRQLSHGSGGSDLRTCVRDGASGLP